ncbi:MAG: hypothetical protein ACXVCP_19325 [Bdellovibrio sp.]
MKKLILIFIFCLSSQSHGALPPQFSTCFYENSGSNMSATDITEIAKVSKVTYCQNQVGIINKADTINLLKNPNIQVGISLTKTAYLFSDLMDLAGSGSYLLYVDNNRLSRDNLISLAQAGVQLVIMTSSSGLSRADLMAIAAAKPFILNVDSIVSRDDLRDYVTAGVQIVIRTSQSGLSRADILDVASVNSEKVSIMP